jgi:hypothetical protein
MSVAIATPISPVQQDMDLTSINTIRTLAMDGVQAANSGHPGTPMAMAPVAYCLWQQFLRFRRTPSGQTAIASCYRSGTRPCCFIPCFT